ncbi:FAD-dependent oxidoreductase [Sphaerisporangium corydalis]|uniref:FAD-dependent oxidoreductase n=1 Tax=Sphaerisporangium corydalis TaxID=1441875 RepID=A0ABV9EDR9_9ACTN|nr:FAD-dependent monooxygenase [Sphaerisporangium corydalis]
MKVIVIGAGLGGLGLAHALLAQGVHAEVFERDTALTARFQGYRVGLGEQGLAALERCVPVRLHPLLRAVSGELTGDGRVVGPQLQEYGSTPRQDEGLLFDRHVLRHLLYAGLEEHVRFGARLESYEYLPGGGVRACFAGGATATADLLVGADGMGSTVRRRLLPSVRILDTGIGGVIGRTPMTARLAGLVPGWSTVVADGDLRLFIGKMPFARPPREAAAELAPGVVLPDTRSYLRWVLLLPDDRPGPWQDAEEPEDGIDVVAGLVAGWHPLLREMIAQGDRDNSGMGPIRYADPIGPWPAGPVTLLGDAAHPMPPGGLGANLAFGDAVSLAGSLGAVREGRAELLEAVAGYEERMRQAAAGVHADAMGTLDMITGARGR